MILRRCSQGHRVRIYRNTTPGISRTKKYKDGSTEVLTYPSSYSYFVEVDGNVEKKTNSFKTAEEFYDAECVKKHSDNHGRLVIGKHHLINNVATSQSDYPTDSSTKAEIQAFYDVRNINYSASDTKAELLSRIEVNDFTRTKSIKR
tara:strand:- start:1521 stop:1961 length:441 start_codon:yes stop_codon:yes gene_type:complete